jgi:hypothetical protein
LQVTTTLMCQALPKMRLGQATPMRRVTLMGRATSKTKV